MVIQVDIEYYNLKTPFADFPKTVKPFLPDGKPFLIKKINEEFLHALKKAKKDAEYKPNL